MAMRMLHISISCFIICYSSEVNIETEIGSCKNGQSRDEGDGGWGWGWGVVVSSLSILMTRRFL